MKHHYIVYTPTYTHYYSLWSLEPPETVCDVVCVEASTKREAKVIAVREMRKQGLDWVLDQQSDGASPFTGLKADLATCEHGVCWCDLCSSKDSWSECKECMLLWEQEDKEDKEEV